MKMSWPIYFISFFCSAYEMIRLRLLPFFVVWLRTVRTTFDYIESFFLDEVLLKIQNWQQYAKKKSNISCIDIPETTTQPETESKINDLTGYACITEFNAPFTQITSKISCHLSHLPNLQIVNLAHTRFCDDGLSLLAIFCELKSLDLSETRVTDKERVHR